jgi:5'-nucleotidase
MNIVITNDDGYDAPGLVAAYDAVRELGPTRVVAPLTERSACSHQITLRREVLVRRIRQEPFGEMFTVDGTPADCIRIALTALDLGPVDLVLAGINRGANAGVDTFYSGTVAGAREGAILGSRAIAASQAIREGVETSWARAAQVVGALVRDLLHEQLPRPGFWSINLPAPIPEDHRRRVHRVPVSVAPMSIEFLREEHGDDTTSFTYPSAYWDRRAQGDCDFAVLRDGGITISAIPLVGDF